MHIRISEIRTLNKLIETWISNLHIRTSEIRTLINMLYYLFNWLNKNYAIPGAGVFQYITFRMAMAVITSLIVTTVFGRRLIDYLRFKQVGETVRNLGLEGQMQKAGTPTMGGIIIILEIGRAHV